MGYLDQVGIAQESGYGNLAVPTRFFEFNEDSLAPDKQQLITDVRGDQFDTVARVRDYVRGGGGGLGMDFMQKGMGIWLLNTFGQVSSAQVGSTPEYVHTFTPATAGVRGKSLTIQKGVEAADGTVYPFTFLGGKIVQATLGNELDQNLKFGVTTDFKDVNVAQALATASYPAGLTPLSFLDADVTLAGESVCARSVSFQQDRALNTDRRCLGNSKREPLGNGKVRLTGGLDLEFEDRDQYDKWIAGTIGTLVATWSWGEIASTGNPYKLVITVQNIKYTGQMPNASGNEIARQQMAFMGLWDRNNPLWKAEYHTTDVLP